MFRITVLCLLTILMLFVTACSDAHTASYDGTWKSSGDLVFIAKIKQNHISVVWKVDKETSGLYWKGSFSPSNTTIVSRGNVEAMDKSIFGSGDKTKKFTYENGTLTFKMSALGVTKTIKLRK